jgi:peptidoglycan/xylan/chitin deacetylase (PgdA/CDA1 family)
VNAKAQWPSHGQIETVGRLNRLLCAISARKRVEAAFAKPVVSFTFDDFPKSALHLGGKILSGRGLRGTYYAALGLMGKTTEVGEIFEEDDLRALTETGHELACHTFEHLNCRQSGRRKVIESCEKNRLAVAKILPHYDLENFSFPFGAVSMGTKAALRSRYRTCRTIEPAVNRSPIDFAFLRAFSLYDSTTSIDAALAESVTRPGWLIIYTHDISSRPSAYGCTPQVFEQVVERVVAAGADVLTIAETVRRITGN